MSAIGRALSFALSWLPLDFLGRILEDARLRKLRKRLMYCGDQVTFSSGFLVEVPSSVSIATGASFGPNVSLMGAGGCTIGCNAMLATGVLVVTTTHDHSAEAMRQTGIHKPVVIENDAWIGAAAILLPGTIVRAGAVVGAGAVVTGEVHPHNIVVGVPARTIFVRQIAGRS